MTGSTVVLASFPSPSQGVWHLGPLPLRAYAGFIIIGIVVACWWGGKRWVARGGKPGQVVDMALWAVPFGLVGGRLYHLATDWNTYFGDGPKQPIDALKIWDGGLGIWGAVLLGAVGAYLGSRQLHIRLSTFGDAIGPPILLAQAIGRLGNYFNQELYGRDTSLPWGLEIYLRADGTHTPSPSLIDGTSTGQVVAVVQPTFLYELIWNVLVVIALVLIDRQFRIGNGRLFALYIAGYCFGRFFVEMLRDDTATHVFGIRINLFTAAVVFIGALIYFFWRRNDDPQLDAVIAARDDGVPGDGVGTAPVPDTSASTDPDTSTDTVTAEPDSAEPDSAESASAVSTPAADVADAADARDVATDTGASPESDSK